MPVSTPYAICVTAPGMVLSCSCPISPVPSSCFGTPLQIAFALIGLIQRRVARVAVKEPAEA
jgi:hypothetical protein